MYILGRKEMQAMDRYTMEQIGLPGPVLMENAGAKVADELLQSYDQPQKTCILVGGGQNGGDGFVIGRRLNEAGWEVKLWLLVPVHKIKGDALVHYRAYVNNGFPLSLFVDEEMEPEDGQQTMEDRQRMRVSQQGTREEKEIIIKEDIVRASVIVDAMLGTGIRGKPSHPYDQVIHWLNERPGVQKEIIAVDIPSGVNSDTGEVQQGTAVKADRTLTFVCPKKGFFLPPGFHYVGKWKALPISVSPSLVHTLHLDVPQLITTPKVEECLPQRPKDGHKGRFGHVLVIGGCISMVGAPLFTAMSAAHSGAGLVSMAIPETIYEQVSTRFPTSMFLPCPAEDGHFSMASLSFLAERVDAFDTVVIGPGLGRWTAAQGWLLELLEMLEDHPLVLDADALHLVHDQMDVLQERKQPTLLTPHPGEMSRLTGKSVQDIEAHRLQTAKSFAQKHRVHLLLKGHRSIVASPEGALWVNQTGNDALAKGGSGDILAGMIGGLMAQTDHALRAMISAAHIHGLAAEHAARTYSTYGVTPEHMIQAICRILADHQHDGKSNCL